MRPGVATLRKEGSSWDLGEGCADAAGSKAEMGENGPHVGAIEGID